MEYSLTTSEKSFAYNHAVLILILMEYSLTAV